MNFEHANKGTCSTSVSFDISPDHTVHNVKFTRGCPGNTHGVGALCEGRKAEDIIAVCRGIRCGMKSTSCPDQLAIGLEEALAAMQKDN